MREIFKDTAFWQPKLLTDANGQTHAEFTLPDNLTTWVLTGVAVGPETVVGESTHEFIVQKDIVSFNDTLSSFYYGNNEFYRSSGLNLSIKNGDECKINRQ